MDAVRFGRALGFGARQAAKTVVRAVDAARTENPSRPAASAAATAMPPTRPVPPPASASARAVSPVFSASPTARSDAQTGTQARGVQEGLSRFKASAVEPVIRLSSVLWLEVTGVFFGIFALSTAIAIWRLRADWRAVLRHPEAHGSLVAPVAIFLLFAYFCISSFVRARRRARRRG